MSSRAFGRLWETCRARRQRGTSYLPGTHTEKWSHYHERIATDQEGIRAAELGADLIATTLAGYTPYSPGKDGPALDVLRVLVAQTSVPVIVEGRIWTVEEMRACFAEGAHAVVIGSAITVP